MSAEWTVRDVWDGIVHRVNPGDVGIARALHKYPNAAASYPTIRGVCGIGIPRVVTGKDLVTCIACIASSMEPT